MKAIINSSQLVDNCNHIKSLVPGCQLVAMVKANAYGHGLLAVTRFFEQLGVSKFGVATIDEGETLREAGIRSQILLMSGAGLVPIAERVLKARITPMISSLQEFEALAELDAALDVHIDIDTGMSRGGFLWSDVSDVIRVWKSESHKLVLEGLSTHFSDAENQTQLDRFYQALGQFKAVGLTPKVIHTSKSSAVLGGWVRKYPGIETWVRPGIALYESVMRLHAPITLIKTIPVGAGVGYDKTWVAQRETQVALMRAGYGDGIPRALSNCGYVEIRGQRAPIVGRVSMDLITADVTGLSCSVGDEVWMMSIGEMADMCGTISYEVMTGISERVSRSWI